MYFTDPDVRHWIELHGIQVKQIGDATYIEINRKCSALTTDKKCGLYGDPDRPGLCSEWPATPAALTGLESVCGYGFIQAQLESPSSLERLT
mgnify:FL=1